MSYEAGARVRVKAGDPDHHTRVPRYVRGHTGVIVTAIDSGESFHKGSLHLSLLDASFA